MSTAVLTANFGNFDPVVDSVGDFDFYRFTESNFPLRDKAMTSRLQARLVKCFGWQMIPKYDSYIWVDSSVQLNSTDWLLEPMQELTVLKHPTRKTIGEEAEYLKERLGKDEYITSRYKNELIDEQMAEINNPDLPLYATTVFAYRPTYNVKKFFKEWWYHISRYHMIDQLSFPYCLKWDLEVRYSVVNENLYKTKHLTHVR